MATARKSRFLSSEERSARIHKTIKARGMTYGEVARSLGIDPSNLKRSITLDMRISTLTKLANALGVSAGFFVDRKETKHG